MTAQDASPTLEQPHGIQFTLRGLMVFVLGVAVGLSVWQIEAPTAEEDPWVMQMVSSRVLWYNRIRDVVTRLTHGLVAAAAAWMALGLAVQVRDLATAQRGCPGPSREQRWGWRFAVSWRVFVVGAVVAHYVIGALLHLGILQPAEMDDVFGTPGKNTREALVLVCIILVLWSVAPRTRPRRTGLGSTLWSVAGVAAAVVLAVIVCAHNTIIQFLVAVAIQGIESAEPLWLAPEGVEIRPWVRMARFHRESALVLGLALLTLAVASPLIRRWTRGVRRNRAGDWVLAAVFAASLAVSGAGLVWLFTIAMPRAFPIMIVAQKPWPGHVWASSFLLVAVLTGACAFRLISAPGEATGGIDADWPSRRRYYHERIVVISFLAVAVGAQLVVAVLAASALFMGLAYAPLDLLARGECLLRLILLVAAAGAVWRLARQDPAALPPPPPALAPGRFAATWLVLFLTALTLLPAIGVFGFTLWFTPWCTGCWP